MMSCPLKTLLAAAFLALLPTSVLAQPVQQWRCTLDSLTPSEALLRVEWARRCGLTTNTAGAGSFFSSSKAFELLSGGGFAGAKEYKEINTSKAYSGNSENYNVNYYYSWSRYETTPFYTVFQETSGPTINYYKWSYTTPRARPLYPSFDKKADLTGGALYPHPNPTLANCNLYTDKNGINQWQGDGTNPYAFYVVAYCESSCYTPDQSLLFSDGEVNIVEAIRNGREDLMTLSPDATLDHLSLKRNTVYGYTSELRDAEHIIYEIRTASGGLLKVTNEHPVVNGEGRLVKAEDLVEGDGLLKVDGHVDPIVSLEKTTHFGKVYNTMPVSRDPVSNLLVAQGYVVGSSRFQNDDVGYMNRILLFRAVPETVMPL